MNVQLYTARFDEASSQFLGWLGLTPSFLKRSKRAAVALGRIVDLTGEHALAFGLHEGGEYGIKQNQTESVD